METSLNLWHTTVMTPPLRIRIVRGLRVSRASAPERGILNRGRECGWVGWVVEHLWTYRSWRDGRRVFVLGVGVRVWVTAVESAGRWCPATLLLHDIPDDDSSDQTDTGETPHNASSNSTSVGTTFGNSPSSTTGASGTSRWSGTSPSTCAAGGGG